MFTRRLQERKENSITGADIVDGHLVLRRYDGSTLEVDVNTAPPQELGNWVKVSEIDFATGSTGNDYATAPQYPTHEPGDLLIAFFFGRNNMGLHLEPAAGFTFLDPITDPHGNGQVSVAWKVALTDSESGLVIAAGRPGVYGVFVCYRNTATNDADPFVTYEGTDGVTTSGTSDPDSLQLLFGWAEDSMDYPEYLAPVGFNIDTKFNVDASGNEVGKQTFVVMSKAISGAYPIVELSPYHTSQGQIVFNAIVSPAGV